MKHGHAQKHQFDKLYNQELTENVVDRFKVLETFRQIEKQATIEPVFQSHFI